VDTAWTAVTRRIFALVLCLCPLAIPLANDDRADSCSEGVVSRLYMGQTTPAGAVTEVQWRAFVAESVTPRFPSGFTELQAQGHWRDDRGVISEEGTRIVEIVHNGETLSRERVRKVAADYKHRFAQQSVLITQAPSFHCL
jgi:Protein of unknown function (DUF3574)